MLSIPDLFDRVAKLNHTSASTGKKFSNKGRKKKQMRTEAMEVYADRHDGSSCGNFGGSICRGDAQAASMADKERHRSDSASDRSRAAAMLLRACHWNAIEAAQMVKDEAAAAIDRTMHL